MTSKKKRISGKSGIQVMPSTTATASTNQPIISDTAPSTNNVDATRSEMVQENEHELEQRYKKLNQRLQIFSFIIAVLAIGLTFWNIKLQYSNKSLQSSQTEFERNQRVVELSVSLGSYWEERLDRDTRYRLNRFIKVLIANCN